MAERYTPHCGHRSTNYAMTLLRRHVELRSFGVPVRCRMYNPSSQWSYSRAGHCK